MKLRPAQQIAVDFALDNVKKQPVALACPTSSGKTWIAKALADSLPGRTAIITYTNVLVGQFLREFPISPLIGKTHYRSASHYNEAKLQANSCSQVIFNPASYILHVKEPSSVPFDNIIIDEMDACLGLFKILAPNTIKWHEDEAVTVENIVKNLIENGDERFAMTFLANQHRYWWETETLKTKKGDELVLKIHGVMLSRDFASKYLKGNLIGMSGTLFRSHCMELFGKEYAYHESPSPIPVENRQVFGFTEDAGYTFPTDYAELANLLDAVLDKFTERPCITHISYRDAGEITALNSRVKAYLTKDDKMLAIQSIKGTDETLLAAGAVEGISLNDDAARLNVILRAPFPCLGSDYVQKRLAMPGGRQWYDETTLRAAVQMAGRSTRTPTDYSKIVIADVRLTRLIKENLNLLPSYFVESLRF